MRKIEMLEVLFEKIFCGIRDKEFKNFKVIQLIQKYIST